MEINNIKWTVKRILTGRTMLVIPLALMISHVLFRLTDALMYDLIPSPAVYGASIWVSTVLSLLAGTVSSAQILKFFCNLKLKKIADPDAAAEYLQREGKFKWHLLFTVGLCILAVQAVATASNLATAHFCPETPASTVLPITALISILLCVLIVIVGRKLNRYMVRITGTNGALIEEVSYGVYDDRLPRNISRTDIVGVLKSAAAYSVPMAVLIFVVTSALKKIGKLMLKLVGISALIGLILGKIVGDHIDAWGEDFSRSQRAAMNGADQQDKAYAEWMRAKGGAKKKAIFSYRQARNAYNYNPNSYDAYRKTNLFKKDYWAFKNIEKKRY